MKNTLFILSLMLVFVSCKKEQVPTEKPDEYWFYNGTISITRNGKEWKPRLCAVYDNSETKASFQISIIDVREDFLWDEFGFYNIPCSNNNNIVEDYKIWLKSKDSAILKMPYALYNGSFNEGADAISVSNMRKDRPHYISITSFNAVTNEVSGNFSVGFQKDSVMMGQGLDTVSYTNVSFSAKIWNQEDLPK